MATLLAIMMTAQIGYARPELLVDTEWLLAHLNDANVRIVDLRRRGYADGHIPGAVWLDNNAIRIADRPPTFLPTPAEFEELMARLGICNTTRVIAYDERGGIYAARLWWILNHYGHTQCRAARRRLDQMDGGAAPDERRRCPHSTRSSVHSQARHA